MSTSLVTKFADKMGVDPGRLLVTLKATAFKQKDNQTITNEQMMSLLVVANEYNLNPFTKEIYAFPTKGGGIVPIVGVDGWCRIINDNKNFNGMSFSQSTENEMPEDGKKCPEWIECSIHRTDRDHPITVREYIDEVYRPPFTGNGSKGSYTVSGPWQTHTKRMLRHKVMIQCARIAFGFSGFYDQDEGERIIEGEIIRESNIDRISDDTIDSGKVSKAVLFFREMIDDDDSDEEDTAVAFIHEWASLSNDERISVESKLKDKATGSKRSYKTILREYLRSPVEVV